MPVEGPDLAAFLVTQMDTLAMLARRLERAAEAERWTRRADRMLQDLLGHCWRGDRFVAMQSGSHRSPHQGDSLIPFAPLILGRRLPAEIARTLVTGLFESDRFLTGHGLASESPKSALYEPNGYWRGPIWAPPTHIIYDGLRQLGEDDHAREVARRFCETCRTSGFAENFNALTGEPLCDKAYTWTASVFLLLANDLLAD
jgi:glycogen debranching enzyme